MGEEQPVASNSTAKGPVPVVRLQVKDTVRLPAPGTTGRSIGGVGLGLATTAAGLDFVDGLVVEELVADGLGCWTLVGFSWSKAMLLQERQLKAKVTATIKITMVLQKLRLSMGIVYHI